LWIDFRRCTSRLAVAAMARAHRDREEVPRLLKLLLGYGLTAALLAGVAFELPWAAPREVAPVGNSSGMTNQPESATPGAMQTQGASSATVAPTRLWSGQLEVSSWRRAFPVVPVDLTAGGELVPPPSVETVGWWSGGAVPGTSSGTVVLAVHRDSRTQGRGPFSKLETLPVGTTVMLGGQVFGLVQNAVYAKTALPYKEIFDQQGSQRLVIVTCGGTFHRATGWDSNVVATFAPIGA
jgi:hypothetical protein